MGLFDEIKCEWPLPKGKAVQNALFQTKDFDCALEKYTITKDGKLIHHAVKYVSVPEKKRPYYGKPEWKNPFFKAAGSIKTVPSGDIRIKYHGDIRFYTSTGSHEDKNYKWHEFIARFTDGKVQRIKKTTKDFTLQSLK